MNYKRLKYQIIYVRLTNQIYFTDRCCSNILQRLYVVVFNYDLTIIFTLCVTGGK
jgi:hypothetical protein